LGMVNSHFQMYVLFQPSGVGTIPVPLGVYNWEWVTNATPSNDGQTIAVDATAQVEPGRQEFELTDMTPTWSNVVIPGNPAPIVIGPPPPSISAEGEGKPLMPVKGWRSQPAKSTPIGAADPNASPSGKSD
jgi:hypothetical protein